LSISKIFAYFLRSYSDRHFYEVRGGKGLLRGGKGKGERGKGKKILFFIFYSFSMSSFSPATTREPYGDRQGAALSAFSIFDYF
jgi:hypothetical protein